MTDLTKLLEDLLSPEIRPNSPSIRPLENGVGIGDSPNSPHSPVAPREIDQTAETSGHWLILLPPERLERWFLSPVSRAELEARYPGAALIVLPEASWPARPATAEETANLTRLVAAVAAQEGFTAEEQAKALSNAMRDPATALRCFRSLLNEGGQA